MKRMILKWALLALSGFLLSSQWTLADQNLSIQGEAPQYRNCSTLLTDLIDSDSEMSRLTGRLRSPSKTPPEAIKEILIYLISHPEWSGPKKHRAWEDLVHLYNRSSRDHWISTPCAKSKEGHVACWGDIRGHLLVFEKGGALYKSFNPERAHVKKDPDGFLVIDWEDPKLKELQ